MSSTVKSEHCLAEDWDNVIKKETFSVQVEMKRPASSLENGRFHKIRKLSKNGIQTDEDVIWLDQNDTALTVEPCTSTGLSENRSKQLKNQNGVVADHSNVKTETYNNSENQEKLSDTGKPLDKSYSHLHENTVDNKNITSCYVSTSQLISKAQNNLYDIPDNHMIYSSDNNLEKRLSPIKDDKLYSLSEQNLKSKKLMTTEPNDENYQPFAVPEKNINLERYNSGITNEEKDEIVNSTLLSTMTYSLDDSIICLDSDDEMPSSQIFDDVQIKIEPEEDTFEDNKEEWEDSDGGNSLDDDYDEISVITEGFDHPWINRLTTENNSKVLSKSTEKASKNGSDNNCVNKNECQLVKEGDKGETIKINEIMKNDNAIFNRVKMTKGSRNDGHNVTKKNMYDVEIDKIIKQSSSQTSNLYSNSKLKSVIMEEKTASGSKASRNNNLQKNMNSVVHNIVSENSKNLISNNRNVNTINYIEPSDSNHENNIEQYSSYKNLKNSMIQTIKSYHNSVDVTSRKNSKCNVLLENKDMEISTVEPEVSSTKENNINIKEINSCVKKVILIDAPPLPPNQSKRRKATGIYRKQTGEETGNKKINTNLKKKKLREIAEKQNVQAIKSDTKKNKGKCSAKIKMTVLNRGDKLVNEIVNNNKYMTNYKQSTESSSFVNYKIPKKGTKNFIDNNIKIENKLKIMELKNSPNESIHENSKQILNRELSDLQSDICLKNITNIAAPIPSTSSKRNVTFNSDVIIHEIECMESCKKKPVKKDVPLVVQNSAAQKPNKVLCKDRTILLYPEETVYDVCSWNILWCEVSVF